VPKPPKTTFKIERFMARHMMIERIVPLAPTSAPVTIKRSLASTKPAAAAAQPGVAVEQRHHDGHVGAADRHHEVHAEERGERRHRDQIGAGPSHGSVA
jgi:hypothetical protein